MDLLLYTLDAIIFRILEQPNTTTSKHWSWSLGPKYARSDFGLVPEPVD